MNGTIRDREKTYRGISTKDTANFEDQRLYYNHIRKHLALKGQTPAENAGIFIDGNKWASMIQNGSMHLIRTNQRV